LPKQQEFTIRSQREGDQVNKIDFVLVSPDENRPSTTENTNEKPISDLQTSKLNFPKMSSLSEQFTWPRLKNALDINKNLYNTNNKIRIVTRDTMIYPKRTILFDVQLYTSHQPIRPGDLFTQLIAKVPGIKVMEMWGKDGLYHYSSGVFLNADQANEYIHYIREKGWIFGFVDLYSGGKRKVITFK
jgi:hypothetical protein